MEAQFDCFGVAVAAFRKASNVGRVGEMHRFERAEHVSRSVSGWRIELRDRAGESRWAAGGVAGHEQIAGSRQPANQE